MTEQQMKIILALAECDMNRTATGRKLYMHVNTVCYHLGLIKNQTGLDPLKFYDLCKLVAIIKDTAWTEKTAS